jgi:hypothetical protein
MKNILTVGFDNFRHGKPFSPNGRASYSTPFSENTEFDLSNPENEFPYGYSWSLGTLERLGHTFLKCSVGDLSSQKKAWLYPLSPVGAFQHWLGSRNECDLFKHCNGQSLEEVRFGAAFILLDYAYEGNGFQLKSNHIFETLHKILNEFKIPARKLIFLFGNLDCEILYSKWCRENGVKDKINLIAANFFESTYYLASISTVQEFLTEKKYLNHPLFSRNHNYLCLNRQPHAHRIVLSLSLFKKSLIENNLFSFLCSPRDFLSRFSRLNDTPDSDWIKSELNLIHSFSEKLPLQVDLANSDSNPAFTSFDIRFYLDSKYSLVTETTFLGENLFLSEKTFKPIAHLHPFVIVGHPGTLRILRSFGYQTFHPWINEEYDEISNPAERLEKIVSEVERLNNLSKGEWIQFESAIFPSLAHNLRHFKRRGHSYNQVHYRITRILENFEAGLDSSADLLKLN